MPTILTRIETDEGVVGWGETVPDQNVTGETWESTYHVIKHELAPLLIDEDPFAVDRIHKKFNEKLMESFSKSRIGHCTLRFDGENDWSTSLSINWWKST